jgi:DNA (cytosine-5)-methyltransferase 1
LRDGWVLVGAGPYVEARVKPRLLDLFCCEGGAARGYMDAGFYVVGVDIEPQPLYAGDEFHQADAMTFDLSGFDAIHASPPCQSYSNMSNRWGSDELELIAPMRERLSGMSVPWVIENVVGARSAMEGALLLHGGQFGLNLYRPRLFESNILLMSPGDAPRPKDAAAVYGRREDRRRLFTRKDGTELHAASLDEARVAMEMPWASWNGVREAIPPAYTEWIGTQLLAHLEVAA